MDAPSTSQVAEKFRQVIEGFLSREDVATWAQKWIAADDPPDMDKHTWNALQLLAGADLISIDRPYLYSADDFARELAKIS